MQVGESEATEHGALAETVELVQAYVRSEPGAWSAFAAHARADPEGVARSLLTLGTVLLDIAAGAFRLTQAEVLDKVTRTVDLHRLEQVKPPEYRQPAG